MKKYQVLIIDDEIRIGLLIKKLIHWDEIGLEFMDVVDNGEIAINNIRKGKYPDIVITDIRMPKIDGLQFISMTKDIGCNIKYIVISGYKEFEYAHRAMQYGVENYLLKPVNENELNKDLKKIVDELNIQRKAEEEQKALQEVVTESRHIIKREFLKNIIEAEVSTEPMDSVVSLQGEIYRGIDIKLDYTDYSKKDEKQDMLMVTRIEEIVEQILENVVEEVLICKKENLHIYCLFNYDVSKTKKIKGCINKILSDIQEQLLGFEQYEVTIGVGTEKSEFGEIRFSIKEANRAIGNRIRQGVGRLIYAESIETDTLLDKEYLTHSEKENIKKCLESYSVEILEMLINTMYRDYLTNEEKDFSECYLKAKEIVDYFFDQFDVKQDEIKAMRKEIQEGCQHCYTLGKLKKYLQQSLGDFLNESCESLKEESTKPVRQARKYIEEHYAEKIVLEDIAKLVNLNPVYFSVLFKKECGINISTYLLDVRMEKAKEFLQNSNDTISAIGERVGYKDTRYFSQTFAKYVGIKPMLYRKLHS